MIIRPYGGIPRTYAADVGEVVEIRLTPVNRFARAVILRVSRSKKGFLRYRFQWLETLPGTSAVDGKRGSVIVRPGNSPLIQQIDVR